MKQKLFFLLLAVISGLLLAASWPANGFAPLIFVAFIPLLYIVDRQKDKRYPGLRVFPYLYLAFVLWNLLTTYWIVYASEEGAFMAIFVNAYIMCLVWMLFTRAKKVFGGFRGYIGLLLFWTAYEYLHLDWDLSWPWLFIGNVFANDTLLIQWYEFTGSMGGTLWVLIINILIYETFKLYRAKQQYLRYAIITVLVIVLPILASVTRYYTYNEKTDPIQVVCVQPNIDPWGKFSHITPQYQFKHLLELSSQKIDKNTDYLIFPETSLPTTLDVDRPDNNKLVDSLRSFLSAYPKLKIITGVTMVRIFHPGDTIPNTASPLREPGYFIDDYNSAIQVGNGDAIQYYHKSKLVPGPEMFPFAETLKPLQSALFGKLGGMIGDLGTQPDRTVFKNSGSHQKAAPVVCYESIYGAYVGRYVQKGATFISISTNDAWWGDTPGYKQLLAYARLRAIECRRSVARSANTGISCFINQRGDIIAPTTYLTDDAIKGTINGNDQLTLYVRFGDYLGRTALLVGLLFLAYTYIQWIRKRKNKDLRR